MMNHIRKNLARILMVTSELRATVVMRKGDDLLYRRIVCQFFLELLLDALSHSVHATDCRNDPKFVTYAGTAVCSAIAFKDSFVRCRSDFCEVRLIGIFEQAVKIGLEVRVINKTSLRDSLKEMTDRKSVFDHVFTFIHITECHFMTCRNSRKSIYLYTIDLKAIASLDIVNRYRYIVGNVYLYEVCHITGCFSLRHAFLRSG